MEYLIGVDAGGTKTKFSLYRVDGSLMKDFDLDAANIMVQKEQAVHTLKKGLLHLLSEYQENVKMILIGIAGIETSGAQETIEKSLKALCSCPVVVISDAKLALINKLQGRDGALLISGTGSVGYGLKNSVFYRVGGWGHLLGDEGSAYSLGLACYKQLVNDLDEGQSLTEFSQAFLAFIGENDPLKAISNFYEKNKKEVAQAALFMEYYTKESKEKAKILTATVDSLTCLFERLLNKMHVQQMELAFAGSVLEKNQTIRKMLLKKLEIKNSKILPIVQDFNTKAVYYYYYRKK
ncbi:BadF/BadG/BcrA/BcrD ATPase family protein [Enterococcus sp. FSL R5-0957]|uniref:N-acetylglucosamine kinase n=1 Tax=Enterococcus sp. FSL R5-0957 TaxID=2921725 RepID=UPI00215BFBF0|nr:BadF/BadG/BcrA/BcrD ATPase family protein [Enterococcus faecium]